MHTKDERCPGCVTKLQGVDPHLANWFWREIKPMDGFRVFEPDGTVHTCSIHVCWGFRGQVDQDADFAAGKSMLKWPNSKHNFMIYGGPHSLAIDLFLIDLHDGTALFPLSFYQEAAAKITNLMTWGGTFTHLKDLDHFQLDQPSGEALVALPGQDTAQGT